VVSPTISHATWGEWPSLRLATPAVEVEVVSEIGARVVSLRDLRRDREWLLQGEPPSEAEGMSWSEEGAVFSGRESFGWDECLPTVSVCADPLDSRAPPLRDHGDQWGRGAYLAIDHEGGAIEHAWSVPRWPYRLSRRLSFADEQTLLARYQLTSLADASLPLLWSQHPVFRLEPGTRLELPGVTQVVRTGQLVIDLPEDAAWPQATSSDGRSIDLSVVHTGLGWATKLYADAPQPVKGVAPDGARLSLDWDRDYAPILGIWLAYGGWPADGEPCEQVALEPTTSAHDDLAAACADGRERVLGPGEQVAWWVRLRLS
jgi:galactose mutarotase-like enzyme